MFIDARTLEDGKAIESDICIIGGGVVGITSALQFIGKGTKVCLLESGGLEEDKETASLYNAESVGLRYKDLAVRQRYFGGCSNSWYGYCRPFTESNFEQRPWVPHSGWPLRRADLVPYYERAQKVCELKEFNYNSEDLEKRMNSPYFQRLPLKSKKIIAEVYQFSSPPTRFGKRYRKDIEDAQNIHTYLFSNVFDIETSESGGFVKQVHAVTLKGNKLSVSAKYFILATGGIENPRLLLLSNKNGQNKGLGNQNDLVGRFFMEHPHFYTSAKIVTQKNDKILNYLVGYYGKFPNKEFTPLKLILNTSFETQQRERLLDYSAAITSYGTAEDFQKAVGDVYADLDSSGLTSNGEMIVMDLQTRSEQSPNPDSRISLSDTKRDKLGLRQAQVDWRLKPIDMESIQRSIAIIGQEIGLSGIGRVYGFQDDQKERLRGGCHRMGTTRMSADPKQGVVDPYCRVHGFPNLYVGGGSVFTTGGVANPVLTETALAIRTADHIKAMLG